MISIQPRRKLAPCCLETRIAVNRTDNSCCWSHGYPKDRHMPISLQEVPQMQEVLAQMPEEHPQLDAPCCPETHATGST